VTIHDFGYAGTRSFIVMEYIEGKTLKSHIKAHAPFTLDEALDLAIQMCAGVGYAHRAGLVHCDLKPQNVLVTPEGRVKVTDFGIARALASVSPGEVTDTVWGSPQYFAPEQAMGQAPTPASDVYSIGIILYEMLAGRLPFVGQTPQQLAFMHLRDEPPPLTQFNPNVPETIERIVHKVLAKEPSSRYRTADQLGRILASYRDQGHERTDAHSPAQSDAATALPPPVEAARAPVNYASGPVLTVSEPDYLEPAAEPGIDWLAVLLALVAFVAVLGLVPLWLFVASQWGYLP
jgi:serine/threonine-protein kinase